MWHQKYIKLIPSKFCKSRSLRITCSWFQRRDLAAGPDITMLALWYRRRITPSLVLVGESFTMNEFFPTDYRLVTKLRIRIKSKKASGYKSSGINFDKSRYQTRSKVCGDSLISVWSERYNVGPSGFAWYLWKWKISQPPKKSKGKCPRFKSEAVSGEALECKGESSSKTDWEIGKIQNTLTKDYNPSRHI